MIKTIGEMIAAERCLAKMETASRERGELLESYVRREQELTEEVERLKQELKDTARGGGDE